MIIGRLRQTEAEVQFLLCKRIEDAGYKFGINRLFDIGGVNIQPDVSIFTPDGNGLVAFIEVKRAGVEVPMEQLEKYAASDIPVVIPCCGPDEIDLVMGALAECKYYADLEYDTDDIMDYIDSLPLDEQRRMQNEFVERLWKLRRRD